MKLVHLMCSTLLAATSSRANDINPHHRGPSADDDGAHISPKDISVLVDENHDQKITKRTHLESPSTIDARELQVRHRGGLFNPPKSSRLFYPPPDDQQQQENEEVTTFARSASTTTSTRTGNIFFAARSATTNMVQLAEGSDSGYLLAYGPSMSNYKIICQDGDCDNNCPESCEVPRTAILRGLIWWIGVVGPTDPNLKKTKYEVKNDRDRVAKGSMIFEGNSQEPFGASIWSFEVDLGSDSDVIPQEDWQNWVITAKQKIEDEDREKLQTDRFELTIIDEAPPPPPPLTSEPSDRPSLPPSREPSMEPTLSRSPSHNPSDVPSFFPSGLPSSEPSNPPTSASSPSPSKSPQPSANPSQMPSRPPRKQPTDVPSFVPSYSPSSEPSNPPTPEASSSPSNSPRPSAYPTQMPSRTPSGSPSKAPSPKPTPIQDTFIGEGDEGYVLGYKETEDSEPIILCGTPAEVGVSCDECPSSCEVPENTILWGSMWNKNFLIDLDVTDPSHDPNGPTTHNDFDDIVRDYNVEIKVNGDREAKPDLTFDPATASWYFQISLASVSALLGDDLNAKMKLKRDDGDVNMVTDPDRVEFTIVPNYVLNYDLVGFAGITTGNHCETSGTTGGQGGQAVTVSVGDEESFYDYAKRDGKYIILVNGMLGPPPTCASGATFCNDKPFYRIASDKSILGLGSGSGFSGAELRIDGNKFSAKDRNIIIRNINIENAPDGFDGIGIQDGAECIWIDHCSFSKPAPGTDGALDIKKGSDYITISWNTFNDYEVVPDNNDNNDFRAMLIGSDNGEVGDEDDLHVTLHHNRFVDCDQRMPRVRFSRLVHVYNNYYENVESYAIGSAMGAYVLVEGNFFDNVEDPIDTCVGVNSGNPPGQPGNAAERNNVYTNSPAGNCHANIDVGDLVELPSYTYTVDSSVPGITLLGAGTGKIVCGSDGLCA